MAKELSKDLFERFADLAHKLEPENLTCDGELSKREVQRREHQLRTHWSAFEKVAGRKVTEQEIWDRVLAEEAEKRAVCVVLLSIEGRVLEPRVVRVPISKEQMEAIGKYADSFGPIGPLKDGQPLDILQWAKDGIEIALEAAVQAAS